MTNAPFNVSNGLRSHWGSLPNASESQEWLLKCGSKARALVFHYLKWGALSSRHVLGLTGQRAVWLTFDDGPHPEHTPRILEALNRRSIKATFFVTGERAKKHLDIVQDAFDAGHRIGNHSFTHSRLTKLDRAGIRREIMRADEVIARFANGGKIFRPPYGARNTVVDSVVTELGYRTVLWNVSTSDWDTKYQPEGWIRQGAMMVKLCGRSTVLLHDDQTDTARHLGQFLDTLARLNDVQFMTPDLL